MNKKILILYTNYGTGHYQAAKAINEYIKNNYPKYEILFLDPLSYSRPLLNKIFAKTGKIVATKFRNFRKKLYQRKMYKNYLKNSPFFTFCTKIFWTKKLEKKLIEFNPNIIISTQVGPTGLIAAHKNMFKTKLVSVFTDYGLHRMYTVAHEHIDLFCVPDNKIKEEIKELKIDSKKIIVTGIPVHKDFLKSANKKEKTEILSKYNLKQTQPTYLFVCGGGLGYDNAFKYFKLLLQSNHKFNYIFVAGKNKKLLKKAKEITKEYNKEGIVLGYVNNMAQLIKGSDLVFGKPGGIITSETLNLEKTICAIEPIPGQETNNALFIKNNNFGFYIDNIEEFKAFLNDLENKKINLEQYEKNIKNKFIKFNFIKL